jgi:hypothetical protein
MTSTYRVRRRLRDIPLLQPSDESFRLSDTSLQRNGFRPQRVCARSAGIRRLTLDPSQLAGHLAHLKSQRADELNGLSFLPCIHHKSTPRQVSTRNRSALKPTHAVSRQFAGQSFGRRALFPDKPKDFPPTA